jgi:hypothetical protein
MRRTGAREVAGLGAAMLLSACKDIDRFDTTGDDAFCGSVVSAQFIRTPETEGGFARRDLRMRLELNMDRITTAPGSITTDDAEDGPCQPDATFDKAPLVTTTEIFHDAISQLSFGEAQEQNLLTWTQSTCRGPMLAVISLLANGDVEVRLLEPPDPTADDPARPAFALFELSRRQEDCGF